MQMSISVTCPQCRKQLKVKDEWAGKTAKCPQCGSKFPIPGGGASAPTGRPKPKGQTVFDPAAAAAARQARDKGTAKFTVSPGLVIGVIALIVVVGGIILFKVGPLNAKAKWEAMGQQAQDDVIDVVTRGLQAHLSQTGGYDPSKTAQTPQAREVVFYWHMFVMDLPDYVEFTGVSTDGEFKGKYRPKTGEVEADVDVGGMGLAGVGAVRKGGEKIKVTGRVKSGNITAEVNGKNAVIIYPKKEDE